MVLDPSILQQGERNVQIANRITTYSEVAPAGKRGKYVVLNHVGFVGGLAAGFW
jgi:hypothetical protein